MSSPFCLTTLTPGRLSASWPCQSVISSATARVWARLERDPELGRDDQADDALAQRRRVGGEPAHVEGDRAVVGLADQLERPLERESVERLVVFAQLLGRAGERLGDARAELALEHRQHGAPHAHARVRGVVVVRVVPGTQPAVGAERPRRRRGGCRAAAAAVGPVSGSIPCRLVGPEPRASPSSTVSAWSSRVWASRMRAAPVCGERPVEGGVPGGAGRGLRARRLGVDLARARRAPGRGRARAPAAAAALGDVGRARLQAVVDDHRAGADSRRAAPRRRSPRRGRASPLPRSGRRARGRRASADAGARGRGRRAGPPSGAPRRPASAVAHRAAHIRDRRGQPWPALGLR